MFEMDSLAKKLSIEKYIVRCLILKPNNFLTWHKDGELVKASVNFHIGESRDPVTFWPDLKYEYNTALLNNQHFHKVDSVSSERVTLKLISLSSSYEDIYKRIKDNDCKIY
jgi:predicted metal-dependent RNase